MLGHTYNAEIDYKLNYFKYQSKRLPLIKYIRKHTFIANLIKFTTGKCVDFGCGSGEQLACMPKGSLGLDVNPYAIEYCQSLGLKAALYQPDTDIYKLDQVEKNVYKTLVMSHLLEHFEDSRGVLIKLTKTCVEKSINTIVIVVPGINGYASDLTHIQYINIEFFKEFNKVDLNGFEIVYNKYYPVNSEFFSKFFRYNELMVVLKRF
jgi:SAM-dependent methyltransferase